MSRSLLDKVIAFTQHNNLLIPQERIVIGCSGGPDSLCLLHLYRELARRFELTLTVAHLNHTLRPDHAQADEDFVRQLAAEWGLPFIAEQQDVAQHAQIHKQSLEEAARQLRYDFLWRVASEDEAHKIAVGHHADDQTETVLMHLLRGAGLEGLRGMVPATPMTNLLLDPPPSAASQVQLIRPLLELSRSEIEAYCQQHQLVPREDQSNQDTTFFRNRIRHDLIPYLETYNPNIRRSVQKLAKIVAADVEVLHDQLDQAWPSIVHLQTTAQIILDKKKWLTLPRSLQRTTLRRAVQTLRPSNRDIGFDHIETAIALIDSKKSGGKAIFPQGIFLQITPIHILIFSDTQPNPTLLQDIPTLQPNDPLFLNIPGATRLPDSKWQCTAQVLPITEQNLPELSAIGAWEAYLDADRVGAKPVLRTRQAGDVFSPLGLEGHHKKVKSFMSDEKIPTVQRNLLPLLVAGGHILWVCGYRLAEEAKITPDSQRTLHLKFERLA